MTAFLFEILVEVMLIIGAGAFVVVPMWIFSRVGPKTGSRCGSGSGEALAGR